MTCDLFSALASNYEQVLGGRSGEFLAVRQDKEFLPIYVWEWTFKPLEGHMYAFVCIGHIVGVPRPLYSYASLEAVEAVSAARGCDRSCICRVTASAANWAPFQGTHLGKDISR
jgi:hypothetical protein